MSDETPKGALRPTWKPGQSGNPSGANAITKALSEFRKFMAEATSTGHTRLHNVWNRLYLGAVSGNVIAGKFIVEQCQGKAKESLDITSSDGSVGPSAAVSLVDAVLDAAAARLRKPDDEGGSGSRPPVSG